MIRIQEIDRERDYELLCGWWRGHSWDPVPKIFLPALGVFATQDG